MRCKHAFFFLVPLVVALALLFARAVATESASAPASSPLAILSPLVGENWVAEMQGGATDTQRFEWMFDRKFLRNTHEVRNAAGDVIYAGETVYGYDLAEKQLRWWYFNSIGGIVEGELEVKAGKVAFVGQNHGGPGQVGELRGEMVLGEGEWSSITFAEQDGEWRPLRTLEFRPADD